MEKKTYVVAISGCDDTSYAIFEDLTEDELAFLEQLRTKINWFSTCSCQPTIRIINEPDNYYYRDAFECVKERVQENCKF